MTTKQQAFDLFEQTRRELLDYARWIAKRICTDKGSVTIDDVRDLVSLPEGIDGRVFGAVFRGDEWIRLGYTHTKIKTSHNRPISTFTLKSLLFK